MIDFFKEIFAYHNHFNQLLLDELEKHADKLPQRTYPLFCHVVNAQQIWNARILAQERPDVRDVYSLEECRSLDSNNYLATIKILNTREQDEKITYSTTRQETFTNTIGDILFHVANHSSHHKGQVISDFRQAGIVPIVTDYIFYKR